MYRRIGRLIQVGIFAALPAGMAFAQSSTSSGNVPNTGGITDRQGGQSGQSATGLAGTAETPDTTTTKAQQKANKVDEQAQPAVPGDSTRPGEMPATPKSDRTQDTGIRDDTSGSTTPGSGATDTDMNKSAPPKEEKRLDKNDNLNNSDTSLGKSDTGLDSSTVEKKSTKHKRIHRSNNGDIERSSSSSVEQKSNLKTNSDDSMKQQVEDKNDLGRDQLDSDK